MSVVLYAAVAVLTAFLLLIFITLPRMKNQTTEEKLGGGSMKKGILSIAALAFVLLISFSSLSVKPAATATEKPSAPAVSQEKILSARFLNMLNQIFYRNIFKFKCKFLSLVIFGQL